MAFNACYLSSVALATSVLALGSAQAQSSHLTGLELAAPAAAPDPVSALAIGGWTSAWLAPSSAHQVTGLLLGLQHNSFSAVTTVIGAARVKLGPLWQFGFAQTSVSDLFDSELLAQFPELGTLRAAATYFGLDLASGLGGSAGLSLGCRYERDEFLGDAAGLWMARVSGTGPRVLGVRSAAAFERVVAGGSGAGFGRLRLGLAREVNVEPVAITAALGMIVGHAWETERGRTKVAGSIKIVVLRLVSLSGAFGAERDPFGDAGWLSFASFGLGLKLGALGVDVRRGDVGASEAVPTAVDVVYQPR